jgi:hypothetical protein
MVADVQDVAADHERGILAACADYRAAVDGRQRGVAGVAGSLAALDQNRVPGKSVVGTSSTLTMKFNINTFAASTWNAWLTHQNTIKTLFSVSQPLTENPPLAITKTDTDLPKEGEVGVLSTLTTPTDGIVCSSYVQIDTGTP